MYQDNYGVSLDYYHILWRARYTCTEDLYEFYYQTHIYFYCSNE